MKKRLVSSIEKQLWVGKAWKRRKKTYKAKTWSFDPSGYETEKRMESGGGEERVWGGLEERWKSLRWVKKEGLDEREKKIELKKEVYIERLL